MCKLSLQCFRYCLISNQRILIIITARLHAMQRTVFPRPFCPSGRLSLRLSVKRMHCDKTSSQGQRSRSNKSTFIRLIEQTKVHYCVKFNQSLTSMSQVIGNLLPKNTKTGPKVEVKISAKSNHFQLGSP